MLTLVAVSFEHIAGAVLRVTSAVLWQVTLVDGWPTLHPGHSGAASLGGKARAVRHSFSHSRSHLKELMFLSQEKSLLVNHLSLIMLSFPSWNDTVQTFLLPHIHQLLAWQTLSSPCNPLRTD